MTPSRRWPAMLLVAGFFTTLVPQMIPLDWVDLQPVAWDMPVRVVAYQGMSGEIVDPIAPLQAQDLDGVHPIHVSSEEVGVDLRALLLPGAYLSAESVRIDDLTHDDLRELVNNAEQWATDDVSFVPQADERERGCVAGSTLLPLDDLIADSALVPAGFAEGGGVVMHCDVVFAAGDVIAVRTRVIEAQATTTDSESAADFEAERTPSTDDSITDTTHVHLIDVVEGIRQSTLTLWSDEAADVLWPVVIDSLRSGAHALSTMPVSSEPDTELMNRVLEETVFTRDGAVLLTVPHGFTAPELVGLAAQSDDSGEGSEVGSGFARTTIAIDGDVGELLAPRGQTVRDLVQSGRGFSAPFEWAGDRHLDCSLIACVALTIDGGPNDHAPWIMDELASADAGATFFVRGELGEEFPDAVWRGFAEGHDMQNGTVTGQDLTKLSDRLDVQTEITSARNTITELIGEVPTMFRPGTGSADKRVVDIARMPAILWDHDASTADVETIIAEAQAGSIVRVNEMDADRVAPLVEGLQARGFEVVTVRQLFGGIIPPPGIYEHAR